MSKLDKEYRISPPPRAVGSRQHSYRVVYEIDVVADSPLEAAAQVYDIMRDPEAIPPAFVILDADGQRSEVDLYEEGLKERGLDGDTFTLEPVPEADPSPGTEPPEP